MAAGDYYRGGASLVPRRRELKFDPATGDVLAERGVSVSSTPDGLDGSAGHIGWPICRQSYRLSSAASIQTITRSYPAGRCPTTSTWMPYGESAWSRSERP